LDVELLIELFTGEVAPKSPIKDEIVFEELAVFRIFVILLTQQYAIPSAGLGEKVDEQGLPCGFGFSLGLVERALEPSLREGRRNGN